MDGSRNGCPVRWLDGKDKGDRPMAQLSIRLIAALVLIAGSTASLAQGGGASAGGASSAPATSGSSPASPSAVGTPAAGSPAAGSAAVTGATSGTANAAGPTNSLNDSTGTANSSTQALPLSPGTNTAGTAQSSGSAVEWATRRDHRLGRRGQQQPGCCAGRGEQGHRPQDQEHLPGVLDDRTPGSKTDCSAKG